MFGQLAPDEPNVGAGELLLNDGPAELVDPNAGGVLLNPPDAGALNADPLLVVDPLLNPPENDAPLLLAAPAIFSCVRPYAAIPNTAPMAK